MGRGRPLPSPSDMKTREARKPDRQFGEDSSDSSGPLTLRGRNVDSDRNDAPSTALLPPQQCRQEPPLRLGRLGEVEGSPGDAPGDFGEVEGGEVEVPRCSSSVRGDLAHNPFEKFVREGDKSWTGGCRGSCREFGSAPAVTRWKSGDARVGESTAGGNREQQRSWRRNWELTWKVPITHVDVVPLLLGAVARAVEKGWSTRDGQRLRARPASLCLEPSTCHLKVISLDREGKSAFGPPRLSSSWASTVGLVHLADLLSATTRSSGQGVS